MTGNTFSRKRRRYALDFVFRWFTYLLCLVPLVPLFMIFGFIFSKGIGAIDIAFLTELPKPVGESGGGIVNALLGTTLLVTIASVLALPIGIAAGTFLSEFSHSKTSKTLSLTIEILNGVPSIVIGIVVYTLMVAPMGGFSALSGGVALGIMMIPVIARNTEETLKMLPSSLKEASLALGATYATSLLRVVLPAGLSGIVTGIIVAVARVAGETAPLLFTAFGNPFVSWDLMKPVASLPLLIFNYAVSPFDDWHRLAWGAASFLLLAVLGLNLLARYLSRRWRWY